MDEAMTSNRNPAWTKDEDDIVRAMYGSAPIWEWIHLLARRTVQGTRVHANRALGLINEFGGGTFKRGGGTRQYDVDDAYFSNPSPDSNYWAGFIAADGSVGTGRARHELSISCKLLDRHHLSILRNAVSPDKPVREYLNTEFPYCKFVVNSKQIISDLHVIYNIGHQKSLTLSPPNLTDHDSVLSFIVGYIDGDGSITKGGQTIRMVGTESFLLWVKSFMDESYPVRWGFGSGVQRNSRSPLTLEYCFGAGRAGGILDCISRYRLPVLDRKWDRIRCRTERDMLLPH